MTMREPDLRPFNASGYEIVDDGFAATRTLAIWSKAPRAPNLGECFTIEREGAVHDLSVAEIRTFDGGWAATCRALD